MFMLHKNQINLESNFELLQLWEYFWKKKPSEDGRPRSCLDQKRPPKYLELNFGVRNSLSRKTRKKFANKDI